MLCEMSGDEENEENAQQKLENTENPGNNDSH